MNCDLCGKESDLKKVKIEGTLLSVCGKCSKFGEIVEEGRILPFPNPTKSFSNELFLERNVHERRFSNPTKLSNFQDREKVKKKGEFVDNIVSDYSVKIKESREKLRLTQKELGIKPEPSLIKSTPEIRTPGEVEAILKQISTTLNTERVSRILSNQTQDMQQSLIEFGINGSVGNFRQKIFDAINTADASGELTANGEKFNTFFKIAQELQGAEQSQQRLLSVIEATSKPNIVEAESTNVKKRILEFQTEGLKLWEQIRSNPELFALVPESVKVKKYYIVYFEKKQEQKLSQQ